MPTKYAHNASGCRSQNLNLGGNASNFFLVARFDVTPTARPFREPSPWMVPLSLDLVQLRLDDGQLVRLGGAGALWEAEAVKDGLVFNFILRVASGVTRVTNLMPQPPCHHVSRSSRPVFAPAGPAGGPPPASAPCSHPAALPAAAPGGSPGGPRPP